MKILLRFVVIILLGTTSCFSQTSSAGLTFTLVPADVPKVVIFMYAGGKCWLEVTYNKEQQEKLTKLAAENIDQPINIVLDGKSFGQRTFKDANVGHSIKVDVASPEEAFATAKALLKR